MCHVVEVQMFNCNVQRSTPRLSIIVHKDKQFYVFIDFATPPMGSLSLFNLYIAWSRSSLSRGTIRLLRDFDDRIIYYIRKEILDEHTQTEQINEWRERVTCEKITRCKSLFGKSELRTCRFRRQKKLRRSQRRSLPQRKTKWWASTKILY